MPTGILLSAGETAANSILSSDAVTFVVDAAKQFIGVMTQPPFGTFITIGILGGVAALVGTLIHTVRR